MKNIEDAAREYGLKVSPHSVHTAKEAEKSFTAGAEWMKNKIDTFFKTEEEKYKSDKTNRR